MSNLSEREREKEREMRVPEDTALGPSRPQLADNVDPVGTALTKRVTGLHGVIDRYVKF